MGPSIYMDSVAKVRPNINDKKSWADKDAFNEEDSSLTMKLKNKLVLMFWRINFLLLTPLWTILFLCQKLTWKDTWNPINPLTVLIATILNFYLPMTDNATDVKVGLQYYHPDECGQSNPGLSLFIIAVTFLPFMTRLLLELRTTFGWMWNEWQLYSQLWKVIDQDL